MLAFQFTSLKNESSGMIGQRKRFGGIVGRLAAATVGPRRSYGGSQKVMMPQKKPARKHLPFSWRRGRMRWEEEWPTEGSRKAAYGGKRKAVGRLPAVGGCDCLIS